jgi:Zn-finger nucleic acid-binding protein
MQCPRCQESLNIASLHGRSVDCCRTCRGVWINRSEFGAMVRETDAVSGSIPPIVPCPDKMNCPRCGNSMTAFDYAYDSGVTLNQCTACQGVWVESGQLQLLAHYRVGSPAIQRLGKALGDEIRTANRLRVARSLLRSRALASMVAITYLLVAWLATGTVESVLRLLAFLPIPLMCIWYPAAMGNLTGVTLGLGRPVITEKSPADVVAICGWLLLLCPLVVVLMIRN